MPLTVKFIDLTGITALVTGGNSGIGLETARMLAEMGADVTIACRNAKKAQDAVDDVEKTTGNRPAVATLDLSKLSSVAAFTDDFIKSHERLDILVNNAGISSTSSREEGLTGDGFEIDFQVNHLGPFLLTNRLLPLLRNAAGNKIRDFTPGVVTVASLAAELGVIDYDAIVGKGKWPAFYQRYANSKLMNTMFSKRLAENLQSDGIVAHSLHPGYVATDIWVKEDNKFPRLLGKILNFAVNLTAASSVQGAMTSVHAATSEEAAKQTGKYWESCKVIPYPNKLVDNSEAVTKLWSESVRLLTEKGYAL